MSDDNFDLHQFLELYGDDIEPSQMALLMECILAQDSDLLEEPPILNEISPIIKNEIKEEIVDLTHLEEEPEINVPVIIENPHVKHKIKSNRCNMKECKTKLGLLGFDCKCGYKFCSKHRHTDTHYCTYDHASDDKKRLINSNPQIINDKLNRI